MKIEKPKIRMVVFQDKDGFSAFSTMDDPFIAALGPTFEEFLDNLMEAINITFEDEDLQYSFDEISLISSLELDEFTFRNSPKKTLQQLNN